MNGTASRKLHKEMGFGQSLHNFTKRNSNIRKVVKSREATGPLPKTGRSPLLRE